MLRSTGARLLGFTAAVGTTVALAGFAASSTGAYFSETKDGTISGSRGRVHLETSDLSLDFSNLLPGEYQTKPVGFTATGTGNEDIWLVLPAGQSDILNGEAGTPSGDAALGRYGHFQVDSPAGNFVSNNLAAAGTGEHSGDSCAVDSLGHGGSDQEAVSRDDHLVPFCPAPTAILLASNLAPGQHQTANITFGITKISNRSDQEDLPLLASNPAAHFQVVATQHGVRPDDPLN